MSEFRYSRSFLNDGGIEAVSWTVDLEGDCLDAALYISDRSEVDVYHQDREETLVFVARARRKLDRLQSEVEEFARAFRLALDALETRCEETEGEEKAK
jgi:hypothetical protein